MQNEKAVILVTVILLVIVLAAGVVFAGYYSDWFDADFSTFYLTVGKSRLFGEVEGEVFGNVRIGVKYDFVKDKSYKVQILPTGEDFYFDVDGVSHRYADIEELTTAFSIAFSEKSFSIRCKDMTIEKVLSRLYPDSTIEVPDDVDSSAHFKLVVSSADGKHSVSIIFTCFYSVTSVEFDTPNTPNLVF